MIAIRQIIENPQELIAVPPEFRHRPIEIIFMALESISTDSQVQDLSAETSDKLRVNWFDAYQIENDPDVLAPLSVAEASGDWEW